MSAIARYFLQKGAKVSGYDRTETTITRALESEGASIHYEDNFKLIDKNTDLVIYTPAIPKDHREWNWLKNNGYEIVKRSDVLQWITEGGFNICVAGTHGKTSITSMIGYLLRHGPGCNAFLGGVSVNFGTNYWKAENNINVVEADEYDRSFLKLSPDIAVITAMDADHLDIYGTVENMRQNFVEFGKRIIQDGLLIHKIGLDQLDQLTGIDIRKYALENRAENGPEIYAENIRNITGGYLFDAVLGETKINDVELHTGGLHNLENMLVAMAVATHLGMEPETLKDAIRVYQGVVRRFEYILKPSEGNENGPVVIDDYAHHPEELRALLRGAKDLFPGHRCFIVFQPHLFTRTRDLANEFAEVLNIADEVYLLPIYPARELPIEGISSEVIAEKIPAGKVKLTTGQEWFEKWTPVDGEMWLLAGAGNIDVLAPLVKNKYVKN